MLCLIYSDVHISEDSSIVKQQNPEGKYSLRLEHIIKSLNWAEKLADEKNCDIIFNLGDTFDKPVINAMEATAIQDIKWSNLPHYILVGNHDSNVASLEYSSVNVLKKLGFNIIDKPYELADIFVLLPYITENNRKKFIDYVKNKNTIVLSHNDIAGFNFGRFVSKEGFDINEIKYNCKYFFNGHLHNSAKLADNVLNVGNLCGQNFSEDAFKYKHGCWLYDTDSNSLEFFENPYALKFYQLEYPTDCAKLNLIDYNNAVLNIKCDRKYKDELNEKLNKHNIVAKRIIYYDKEIKAIDSAVKLEKVDHLKQLSNFILNTLGDNNIVVEELGEICK